MQITPWGLNMIFTGRFCLLAATYSHERHHTPLSGDAHSTVIIFPGHGSQPF